MGRSSGRAAAQHGPFLGRSALVTGAASGIGRALATALVERGATVLATDLDGDGAATVAEELGGTKRSDGSARAAALDVSDAAAFEAVVGRFADEEGGIDFLFNNAGIPVGGEVRDLTVDHWRRVVEVNLLGVVHGVAAAYPRMLARGRGHLVNTASLAGLVPSPLLVPYSTTKHAVVGLSVGLRMEAAPHGVRVSVVCPGVIETPLLDRGNPGDLAPAASTPDIRAMLTAVMGPPYPAASLARDVLDGVARNRPIIVTPRRARLVWSLYRLAPTLLTEQRRRTMPAPRHPTAAG